MPIRSVVALVVALVAAVALAACIHNPDPRVRSLSDVVRDGRGGWIRVEQAGMPDVLGELISVDADGVRVLTERALLVIPHGAVTRARLWAWEGDHVGYGVWGTAGTVSTASHGFFLIFTAPLWVITASVLTGVESRAPVIDYPEDGWSHLMPWARFPQGAPPGASYANLIPAPRTSSAAPRVPAASAGSQAPPPLSR